MGEQRLARLATALRRYAADERRRCELIVKQRYGGGPWPGYSLPGELDDAASLVESVAELEDGEERIRVLAALNVEGNSVRRSVWLLVLDRLQPRRGGLP